MTSKPITRGRPSACKKLQPITKRGRPRKQSTLNDLERNWIKIAYSRGVNKFLISRCFHVDLLDISRFCEENVTECVINRKIISFEEVFLRQFNEKVRNQMNEQLLKLKTDSIACHGCRLSILNSASNSDIDWCYHNTREQVEKHLESLRDTVITGTWNGDWCGELPYNANSVITLINAPDSARFAKLPNHKFRERIEFNNANI